MTRLVICCDGTWNAPDEEGGPTNVAKIATQVAVDASAGQRVYYDPGVGTGGRVDHLIGGATGYGLGRNVRDAYRWLVRTFVEGDQIFLVGFSRGAYTVRSLAGLIRNCGVLRAEHVDRVDAAYRLYRSRSDTHHPSGRRAALFRDTYAVTPRIRFIGVFDTVGALGVPLGTVNPLARRVAFHDTELSSFVDSASQALAIGERRRVFAPSLWTRADAGQDVAQVWFEGVHSDVGGGYPDPELAEITLLWMVGRARAQGLRFAPGAFARGLDGATTDERDDGARLRPSAAGRRHSSMTWMYRWPPPRARRFERSQGVGQYIAASADAHVDQGFADAPPAALEVDEGCWGVRVGETMCAPAGPGGGRRRTGIVLAAGGRYRLAPARVEGWQLEQPDAGAGRRTVTTPWTARVDGELVWRPTRRSPRRGPAVDLVVERLAP